MASLSCDEGNSDGPGRLSLLASAISGRAVRAAAGEPGEPAWTDGKVVFVDFGLGEKSTELEARGVDLHLMKRALQSTHYRFAESCFESVVEGYADVMNAETLKSVLAKIREIERRGRYVAERKQEDVSV